MSLPELLRLCTPFAIRLAMRYVIARVFPVPAPARISTGPSVVSAASRCSGLSSSRKLIMGPCRMEFVRHSMVTDVAAPGKSPQHLLVDFFEFSLKSQLRGKRSNSSLRATNQSQSTTTAVSSTSTPNSAGIPWLSAIGPIPFADRSTPTPPSCCARPPLMTARPHFGRHPSSPSNSCPAKVLVFLLVSAADSCAVSGPSRYW